MDLLERIERLENAVFKNTDIDYYRYVIMTPDNQKILTHNSFKRIKTLNDGTIKLFHSSTDAKDFLKSHATLRRVEVVIKRVRVSYQFINEVLL